MMAVSMGTKIIRHRERKITTEGRTIRERLLCRLCTPCKKQYKREAIAIGIDDAKKKKVL